MEGVFSGCHIVVTAGELDIELVKVIGIGQQITQHNVGGLACNQGHHRRLPRGLLAFEAVAQENRGILIGGKNAGRDRCVGGNTQNHVAIKTVDRLTGARSWHGTRGSSHRIAIEWHQITGEVRHRPHLGENTARNRPKNVDISVRNADVILCRRIIPIGI